MAEPLKNQFGPEISRRIAGMISSVFPLRCRCFVAEALKDYGALDLTRRGRQIARALRSHLPDDYAVAAGILIASLGPKLDRTKEQGMAPFLYLPHVLFVAEYGLDHFEVSMQAQYELTQRFTAEFSIRPFLVRYPEQTLARLTEWTQDPSPHVRRLVSEEHAPPAVGAAAARSKKDPRPILALLELLRDDPELYVRRSVANNLNDIGKITPALLVETVRRWMTDATEARRRLILHALRSAIKRGEPGALGVLGFGKKANVAIQNATITPKRPHIGGSVTIGFDLVNQGPRQRVLVDFRIHFVKANGRTSPKVFKLKTIELAPKESVPLGKTISLREMSTRRPYPGTHRVEVVLNGTADPLGSFELVEI